MAIDQDIKAAAALLTNKQRVFADEYFAGPHKGNATASYKAAYPTCKSDASARAGGTRLLSHINVIGYLEVLFQKSEQAKIMSVDEAFRLLTEIARGEIEDEQWIVEGGGRGFSEGRKVKLTPRSETRRSAANDIIKNRDVLDRINGKAKRADLNNEITESLKDIWKDDEEGDDIGDQEENS